MCSPAPFDCDLAQESALAPGPGLALLGQLGTHYLEHYPSEAANTLLDLPPAIAAGAINHCRMAARSRLWKLMPIDRTRQLLTELDPTASAVLLQQMGFSEALPTLRSLDENNRIPVIGALPRDLADSFEGLLRYPDNTAGAMMSSDFHVFFLNQTAGYVVRYFRRMQVKPHQDIYLLDHHGALAMRATLNALIIAPENARLSSLADPIIASVSPMTTQSEVWRLIHQHQVHSLPVIDSAQRLVGVIHNRAFRAVLSDSLTISTQQTIAGGNKDEHALATSRFAVRSRQVWLQVNLLTVFLSSMVFAFFEQTTIQISAMAVLLSVASGQASSTGAQALAVTMRSLALREITVKHWRRIAAKEAKAGLLNGVAVASTAALGVFCWRHNTALASSIAIALLLSMVLSATIGSLVPLCLKWLKQDPAQSASIILSTLTNIIGLLVCLAVTSLFLDNL